MRSVAPITKIVPQFLWSAKMPKIYAKCQKFMQKLLNFIFCHLNIIRAVYKLSFKLLVRSVAHITKIVPPFLWFRGGLCYKQRRIRHGDRLGRFDHSLTTQKDPIKWLLKASLMRRDGRRGMLPIWAKEKPSHTGTWRPNPGAGRARSDSGI